MAALTNLRQLELCARSSNLKIVGGWEQLPKLAVLTGLTSLSLCFHDDSLPLWYQAIVAKNPAQLAAANASLAALSTLASLRHLTVGISEGSDGMIKSTDHFELSAAGAAGIAGMRSLASLQVTSLQLPATQEEGASVASALSHLSSFCVAKVARPRILASILPGLQLEELQLVGFDLTKEPGLSEGDVLRDIHSAASELARQNRSPDKRKQSLVLCSSETVSPSPLRCTQPSRPWRPRAASWTG